MSSSESLNDDTVQTEIIESAIPGVTIESNVPQLAEQLFSVAPKDPFTVGLQLETEGVTGRSPQEAQTIFEVLAHMLLYGVKVKYGQTQDPRKLNDQQVDTLNKYMRSFGFNIVLTTYSTEEKMEDPENYTPTDIEFYRLRMIDPDLGVWHDIKIEPYKLTPVNNHTGTLL